MLDISCPHCPNGTPFTVLLTCQDRFDLTGQHKYRLVKCSGCNLVFLNPRPAEDEVINHYQSAGYDPFLSLKQPQGLFERLYSVARSFTLRWKRSLVNKILSPAAYTGEVPKVILDLGCGTGEFLNAMQDHFLVEGIEPEPRAAQWARERLGLTVHTGNLHSVDLTRSSYDLITMWHVLEHIPDPISELKLIHSRLNSTGRLLVAVPNIDSLDSQIYRANWVALDAPRHLWHFTPDTIVKITRKAGFKLISKGMLPLDTVYNSMLSERALMNLTMPSYQLLAPLHLASVILLSLIWGLIKKNHSSMYYVFEKSPAI